MTELKPTFTELSGSECRDILARNNVGRIAFLSDGHVAIEPIHYVYRDNWIHCRTSPGSKTDAFTSRPWVAFEVDEIEELFRWRSVVVRGTVRVHQDDGSSEEVAAFERGVDALRELIPNTLREGDPVAFRRLVFGIFVHEVTGRSASP